MAVRILDLLLVLAEHVFAVMFQIAISIAGFVHLRGKTGEFLEDRSTQTWKLTIARAQRLARECKQLTQSLPGLDIPNKGGPKIYWFHVASAGELEQAIPIARTLASDAGESGCFFIVSYTSPSTKPFLKNFPNQPQLLAFALHPFSRRRIWEIMSSLPPLGLFFVRYDLWPGLIATARSPKVPLYLIGATRTLVRGGAIAGPSARLKTAMLRNFDQIFALTAADAQFYETFLERKQVTIAGEPKWARAKERAQSKIPEESPVFALRKLTNMLKLVHQKPIIAFGSPHRDEWAVLQRLLSHAGVPEGFTVIVAPHDVAPAEISRLRAQLSLPGVRILRLSQAKGIVSDQEPFHPIGSHERIVWLIDLMGYLAEVYGTADLAVVGGGFDGGLHNCLEPAAQGIPVLFGANHARAPEAGVLVEARAARSFATTDELFQFLLHCVSVQKSDLLSTPQTQGATLPQMALNATKLFESIPKTNQIIQAYLKTARSD